MATYYFKNGATNNFSDISNWYSDIAFTSPAGQIPTSADSIIIGDGSMVVSCFLTVSFLLGSTQSLEITPSASLYIADDGYFPSLTNSGSIAIRENGTLAIYINTSFVNNQTFSIDSGGTLTNAGTFINNIGATVTNFGSFSNYASGIYTNTGSINNYGGINNSGNIECSGNTIFSNNPGGTLVLQNTPAVFVMSSSTQFIINDGSVTNYGNLIFPAGALVTVTGSIINQNIISNYTFITINPNGTINNQASVLNFSSIKVDGMYTNANTTINNGIFSATSSGFISVRPASTFTNNNRFIFGSKSNTYFKGDIFPQVPSSAAFGTAVLF